MWISWHSLQHCYHSVDVTAFASALPLQCGSRGILFWTANRAWISWHSLQHCQYSGISWHLLQHCHFSVDLVAFSSGLPIECGSHGIYFRTANTVGSHGIYFRTATPVWISWRPVSKNHGVISRILGLCVGFRSKTRKYVIGHVRILSKLRIQNHYNISDLCDQNDNPLDHYFHEIYFNQQW